ncbi:GGDEF domain-containing protein [Rhodocyclus tenuis]|uniref:diguanylate cyclase n=1 Tax=Rhodocyclus tenuis TaxID=1066 RepID=A0A840FXW5_RHOTE|nr:GGDEF domain-containing protein [Rhodocyclus tenuis]MBB4246654.1 diguanylate cyclase [Rhodocyclus tenuis]MBK1679949.1 GGDEF domain-containing protein [Rhodocyclus tenuis]
MPPSLTNPSEIARETLRMLASRRMAPSPDNYRTIYQEISGVAQAASDVFPTQELKALLSALPKDSAEQQRLARQFDQAIRNEDWNEARKLLVDFIKTVSSRADLGWGELIGEILRLWETHHAGLTPARKREGLEHILASAANNNDNLYSRLQGLMRSWKAQGSGEERSLVDQTIGADEKPGNDSAAAITADAKSVSRASELLPELRELFAYTLDGVVATQLSDAPELAAEARALAAGTRATSDLKSLKKLQDNLRRFAFRFELLAEDRTELRAGLLHLLQLLIDNVSELVLDDRWLSGQIAAVQEIVARPMNIRAIDDAERRLKEVIFKQSQLKQGLTEARTALKNLIAGFVDHLAEFTDSTSEFHDKIESCAKRISQAEGITQLESVLDEVMSATRAIQLNAQRSQDELRSTRARVEEAERRVNELQQELDRASNLVRHDQLTGTLNRRGLEDAFDKEAARALRRHAPLCVGLLDIDNFKKLNDVLGHDAGDAALVHLATVIRETLRPQDTIARLGGEEFIVLLPETDLDAAAKILQRLQRELTRRFFLHNNDKLLITFSAGVTELQETDTQTSVTKRADELMYQAKQTGKNRVVAA